MTSSTVAASSLVVPTSVASDPASLSCSSSPFLASALPLAPLKRRSPTSPIVSARCSLTNENQSISKPIPRREILGGVATAAAALAVFSNVSLAAVGPGTSGAERTAQKANDLLKSADKLNIEDAPKRFGPGSASGAQDAGKIAQQSGGGAMKGVQQKVGDVGKRASDASGDIEKGTRDILGQFQGRKGEAERAAKDVVGQAQRRAGQATGDGGVFDSIRGTIEGIKENVAQ